LLVNDVASYDRLVTAISAPKGYARSEELVECLLGRSNGTDYYTQYASLLFQSRKSLDDASPLLPVQVFELTLKVVEGSKLAGRTRLLSSQALIWLKEKWKLIWEQQRFLLRRPGFHESEISSAWEQEEQNETVKLLDVLLAILPAVGISNESEIKRLLEDKLEAERQSIAFKPTFAEASSATAL
jgi:hypothetical protein